MADDTRQTKLVSAHEVQGDKPFTSKQWEGAEPSYKPPQNANLMPGGTEHTAGGRTTGDVSMADAAQTIKWEDWNQLPKKPCVRDSLMTGIGTGAAMGATRAIWKAPVWTACSWAVGTFCFGSFAMYQYCNYQRLAEKEGMKRAMEIIDRKQVERKQKEARLERARDLRRERKEQEQEEQFAKLRVEKGTDGGSVSVSGNGGDKSSGSAGPWWKVW